MLSNNGLTRVGRKVHSQGNRKKSEGIMYDPKYTQLNRTGTG